MSWLIVWIVLSITVSFGAGYVFRGGHSTQYWEDDDEDD